MGFFSGILDVIFPPRCVFCYGFLKKSEHDVCGKCSLTLPLAAKPSFVASGQYFDVCVSPFYYTGSVRQSLHRYKFGSAQGNSGYYGKKLAECISENLSGRYDLISWVPISKERMTIRGYDQAMLLAEATALELNDVAVETLRKIKNNEAQSKLSGSDRRNNVKDAYTAVDRELIANKRILLIDDIITTGATLSECAKTLRIYGAKSVVCATFARDPKI